MTIALDIGATNIRIAEVSQFIIKNKIKTPTPKTKKEILEKIISLIKSYKQPQKICIALAGFEQKGKIQGALNWNFNNVPLKKILQDKFKVPIFIQNDARCAGLAELKFGAGKSFENFVLLTLGTGIGGAIIINKKLYLGQGAAGEVGRMILEKEIFEHLASGKASLTLAKKQGFENLNGDELNELANKGNKRALEIYKTVGSYLGIGMANISYILHPQAFILGGGFSNVKHFYPEAIKTFKEKYGIDPKPKILKARFGDDAGLIGAALLTKD